LNHMLAEPYGMVRFRMIRGLGRIATDHPDVRLDNDILKQATMRTLEAAFRLAHWRSLLEKGAREEPRRATRGHGLLTEILHDKEVNAVERLFRLLGLRYRGENFQQIHRGLRNMDPKVRSGSRELLENLLHPPLREAVLALVDDAADDVRLARAAPFYQAAPMDYEAVLVTLLESSSETMQSIAAYHVGELGLTALRGRLETIERRRTGFFVSRVVERTLRQLADPSPGMAHAR